MSSRARTLFPFHAARKGKTDQGQVYHDLHLNALTTNVEVAVGWARILSVKKKSELTSAQEGQQNEGDNLRNQVNELQNRAPEVPPDVTQQMAESFHNSRFFNQVALEQAFHVESEVIQWRRRCGAERVRNFNSI